MSSPFIGEMRIVAFNFAPKGWALCNGQPMTIQQNKALFSIFGTTYGGDGTLNFNLPDLQGRTPIHVGNGYARGNAGGEVSHMLAAGELPTHNHLINATNVAGTSPSPSLTYFANSNVQPFRTDSGTTMSLDSIVGVGSSQPHNNMQPFLVVNIIVALVGIFPSSS
jgi:microcystin-dependent protein